MKNFALTIAAATALVSAPAMAQDTDSDEGGLFVGAVVGYDNQKVSSDGESGTTDGLLYGINVSYEVDSGAGLFGVEAEITDSTAGVSGGDVLAAGDSASFDSGRDIYAGIRAGLQIDPGEVIYFKAGYTNARLKFAFNDGTQSINVGENVDGYRLGVGYQTSIGGLTARIEYRYSDYQELEIGGIATGVGTSNHQGALVLGTRF